jgi:alkylation response protein AidB-like acyl-CoA dehydrogenase
VTTYLAPTPEQQALRTMLRSFFAERWSEPELRRVAASESGHDPALWTAMASELGLHGLAVPEELGGGGFEFADQLVVFEEMGRALVGGPFFASVAMAAPLLAALRPDPARDALLADVAAGEKIATVAVSERPTQWDARAVEATATPGADGSFEVSGAKLFVLDGQLAHALLVVARTSAGTAVLLVEPGARGLRVEPMTTIDPTRRQARVLMDSTPARLLTPGYDASAAVQSMCQHAAVALAAEQVGGAQYVLEMAVQYATVREQFGRTIGSFQAVKHQLADLLVQVEAARAALAHAVAAWSDEDGRARAASVAKAFCSEVFVEAADRNIHVHGGIGFTWEHPAHFYFKRALTGEVLLGGPRQHREMIVVDLLAPLEAR